MTTSKTLADMIDRKEARKRLGCSQQTVDNYLAKGWLTRYKDGRGRVWIDPAEVERLLTPVPVVVSANR
jgi:hypothetical protein